MKKILTLFTLSFITIAFSQKRYTKVTDSKVDANRVQIAEQFIKEYFAKCERKDYSSFKNFKIDKRLERILSSDYEKACEQSLQKIGTVKIKSFDSAYLQDYSKNTDPKELIIFQADFEKSKDAKYVSIWIYRDQNVISGIWVSEKKPLGKSKSKKESAL